MITFHRHEDGSLLSAITGELFGHMCEFNGRILWVNDDGVRTLFARMVLPTSSPPRILRLKVEKGVLKAARDVKPTEKIPETIGQAVWPLPNEIGEASCSPASESAETRAAPAFEPVALIEFAGHNYEIDAASLAARVTELPDETRVALHVTPSGRVLATAILRDEPRDAPHGFAELVPVAKGALALASGAAAEMPADGLALAPPSPETLAALFATGANALDPATINTPLANPPILFFAFGHEEQTAEGTKLITHACRGIVLGLFRVPDDFGSPNTERAPDGTIIEKERIAAWFLTTTDGVIVSSRDQKLSPAPAGSVVWVDVKADLRPIYRYVPKIRDGKILAACEMFVRPLGKRRYEHTLLDGKKEPRYPWRIELKWIRTITNPAQLAAVAAAAMMVPELPGRDGMDLAPSDGNDGF